MIFISIILQGGVQLLFELYSRQANHLLKMYLQAGSPVLMEQQIPVALG